jgi:hypothetical protein
MEVKKNISLISLGIFQRVRILQVETQLEKVFRWAGSIVSLGSSQYKEPVSRTHTFWINYELQYLTVLQNNLNTRFYLFYLAHHILINEIKA